MIEAAVFWNEPNNKSHWDFEIDPEWRIFADMIRMASGAVSLENPRVRRVLGGISPIDPGFVRRMEEHGALESIQTLAVHGFPLDWNHWRIDEWPNKLDEIRAVSNLPLWVTEVGVSTFGADEVQAFGVQRTAERLRGEVERIHWYSLFDLPGAWEASTRHKAAEGASYFRHFHMGLVREDGSPKPALEVFRQYTPDMGLCQWFHFQDHRLEEGARWLRDLGVRHVRTGLSWADSFREGALDWFDRQMETLAEFQVSVTFCFTPEHLGIAPHHTSPPQHIEEFAEFCVAMIQRYGPQ